MKIGGIDLSEPVLDAICRKWRIRRLSVFGSAPTPDFRPDSDIDLLAEFEPGEQRSLMDLARAEREFVVLLGRKVDLVPKDGLKPPIRKSVLARTSYMRR